MNEKRIDKEPFYRNFPIRLSESSRFKNAKIIGWFSVNGEWKPLVGEFVIHQDSPTGPHYIEFHIFPTVQGFQQGWQDVIVLSQVHADSITPINHPEVQFEIVQRFEPHHGIKNIENHLPST